MTDETLRKGEATRQHIVAKAAAAFNRRGFAGCSIQDLMEATGLEKGGIYRHFGSKEELAVEAYRYALEQVLGLRLGRLERPQGAIARLEHIAKVFFEVPSPIPGGCPLMNAAADVENTSRIITSLAREGLALWKKEVATAVEEGLQAGEIKAGVSPRTTANAFIALLEGAQMISRLEGTKEAMHDGQIAIRSFLATLQQ